MKAIANREDLKEAILLLEIRHREEGLLLKEQFKLTYESLRPVNLIRSTLSDLVAAPGLKGNILNTVLSYAAGHLSKKMVVGEQSGFFKQLLGSLLQVGVTGLVASKGPAMAASVSELVLSLFKKKTNEPEDGS